MTTPRRYQRSRAKGARLPPGVVCVTRGTRWGNPFTVPHGAMASEGARAVSVMLFGDYLRGGLLPFTIADVRRELRGRDLACWCPLPEPGEPDHCHAAILLEVANAPESQEGAPA